jgi:hypothetical protein
MRIVLGLKISAVIIVFFILNGILVNQMINAYGITIGVFVCLLMNVVIILLLFHVIVIHGVIGIKVVGLIVRMERLVNFVRRRIYANRK